MFICRLDDVFGFGDTPGEAWEDFEAKMLDEYPEGEYTPVDCQFYRETEVEITSKTTWEIVDTEDEY